MSVRTSTRIILATIFCGIAFGILQGLPETIEALGIVLGLR